MRSREGLSPTRPLHEAGIRIESAAVVGVGDRYDPRRDRRSRAAAGAAGTAPEVPRIMHRAERAGLGGRVVAELGRLRGAGEHQAGAAKARHQFGVSVGDVALRELRAHLAADAFGVQHDLLDQERDAGEWAARKSGANLGGRFFGNCMQHRVDSGIYFCHRLEGGGREFVGRHLLASYQFGQSQSVVRRVIAERNHRRILPQKSRSS